MATDFVSSNGNTAEDEYIDIDINSATFLCYTICSPPQSREFEFRASSHPPETPADELFYNGKLLPLLKNPNADSNDDSVRVKENAADHTTGIVSASSSCYDSGELNLEVYFNNNKRKQQSEKLKWMRKSSLCIKYIKSLFAKSVEPSTSPKANVYAKAEKMVEEECTHRNSFSSAINWILTTKSSPTVSFSSVNSASLMLKRSSTVNSEVERPIEGAIAHCKNSQLPARKSTNDVGYIPITSSKIVAA